MAMPDAAFSGCKNGTKFSPNRNVAWPNCSFGEVGMHQRMHNCWRDRMTDFTTCRRKVNRWRWAQKPTASARTRH